MSKLIFKTVVFFSIFIACQIVLGLKWSKNDNGGIKIPLVNVYANSISSGNYNPTDEIVQMQKFMVTDRELGFLWKKNLDSADNAYLQWGDVPAGLITTDTFGFNNSSEAIAELNSGRPIDIAGVGASYMGGAQPTFYDLFGFRNQFYYNFAQGRFTQPQFNVALKKCVLPRKPKLVVYGLNEVSYTLIDDYEKWKKSELDWFTYHSGTWCGPAVKNDFFHTLISHNTYFEGIWTATEKKLFPPMGKTWFQKEAIYNKTFYYVKEAFKLSRENGSEFVVLFIPSRQTAALGPNAYSSLFNAMIPKLKQAGIDYIDLRYSFGSFEDPRALYFVQDSHWNRQGIYKAAIEIQKYIENKNLFSSTR